MAVIAKYFTIIYKSKNANKIAIRISLPPLKLGGSLNATHVTSNY